MSFYVKRFATALGSHKGWATIIPLSLLIYLAYAAVMDVKFSISQDLEPYNADVPLSVAHNPVATIKLGEIIHQPSLLFLEGFSLKQIQKKVTVLKDHPQFNDENQLSRFILDTMQLDSGTGDQFGITFKGGDPIAGKILVEYYSQRLLTRVEDGLVRVKDAAAISDQRPDLKGTIVTVAQRTLWDKDRLWPLGMVLILSTLFYLTLVAAIEFTHPAFKSEREMARYLGIPVLGIVPNVDHIARSMPENPS